MTERPANQSAPSQPRRQKRASRWPWVLLGTGLVVGGLVAYAPTLFGGAFLKQFGEGVGLQGGTVSGPLWSPTLSGAQLNLPGVTATAGQANVTVTSANPITKTLHLDVALNDAAVNLKLSELMSGGAAPAAGGGSGWKILIDRVDVQDSRLNIDGKGMNVPNVAVRLSRGPDGKILVHGRTPQGPLSAQVQVDTVNQNGQSANRFTVNFDADARILREYWPGVQAGWLRGRYVLGEGPVHGDVKLYRGRLQVPQAKFVTVTGVQGSAVHRGDSITMDLTGSGWSGPITAHGGVDLKAKNWTVTADAMPTLAGLARSLNTTGQGGLKLRVTAGGWSTVRVKAYAQGSGKLAGVAFQNANAEYTFLNRHGQHTPQTNDLQFSASTELAGQQALKGQWAFQRGGWATWKGELASQALDVKADINDKNLVSLAGQALGGPLSGTFDLHGQQLNAVLNPSFVSASARVALSGTPENLRASITNGMAGPFPLAGTAHFTRDGLTADLGTLRLALDKTLKGQWAVQDLSGAGLNLNGRGQINVPEGDLTGNVQATVPGVAQPLSGPLSVNYLKQTGTFRPAGQMLTWQGRTFGVQASDLALVGGARASGNLQVDAELNAYGTLRVLGNGYNLRADAQGQTARLRGTAGGVNVTADASLKAPYSTVARLDGTDIRGTLSVQNGVRFNLTTLGETASGVLNGERWDARGRVNLAALRPLLPVKDLAGTLDLNLAGLGGTAQVNATASGTEVRGTLTRTPGTAAGGRLLADLIATLPTLTGPDGEPERPTARIGGQVYPDVQASGTLSALGQRLNLNLNGPYSALAARVTGRTGELAFGSVTVPGQAVNLRARLTPALSASGTWGDLNLDYNGTSGLVSVSGAQVLSAMGQTGTVQGQATWGPQFKGNVNARGVLGEYAATISGPWQRLNVLLSNQQGLRASGTASLPDASYDLQVNGPVTIPGQGTLTLNGNVRGSGTNPTGRLTVRDAQGGQALVNVRNLQNIEVTAQRLTLAGQTLEGTLTAQNGVLNGRLQAGPLNVIATNGQLRATGELAGHQVVASGTLSLPSTLRNLNVRVTGPYLTAQASGDLNNLRGLVNLRGQRFGSAKLGVLLPAQTLPLRASATGARVNVGGLVYQGGRWSGSAGLVYSLLTQAGTQRGRLSVVGSGETLTALPTGPLGGQVQLLPALGGTLTANLAPFMGLLPAELRPYLRPGQLVAQVRSTGADLSLRQTRYLNQPLSLDAQADWRSGVKVQGVLAHPGSRLPVVYDGQNLTVRGATLDARALQPVLEGATGRINLNLSVPGMNFQRASGLANVNIGLQGQRASGNVALRAGQLSANLSSTLKGYAVQLSGPIYPQANANLSVRQGTVTNLTATLRGSASSTINLSTSGTVENRALNVRASASGLTGATSLVRAAGTFSGAAFNVNLNRAGGSISNLAGWRSSGTLTVPDLRTLADIDGQLSATLGGTLANLQLRASGKANGIAFTAPASFSNGTLRVSNASATLPQGQVTASGTVFPALNLQGRANIHDVSPGQYTAQVSGTFSRPDVRLQGQLATDVQGFEVAGTRLNARLFGKDWLAQFTGTKLNGVLRGQLNSGALGGLQRADLTLNTRYRQEANLLQLVGRTAWNARDGWGGQLRVTGDVPGGPLDAFVNGRGPLQVTGTLGSGERQAGFNAQLPANLPLKPAGTITVTRLDAGAFWGRAGQVQVTGTGTLGGTSWNKLEASFAGGLHDTQGELSGELRAQYAAGNVQATLYGAHVSGSANLVGERYDLTLKADPLHLSRLLPVQADLNDLTFGGTVQARGSTRSGPEVVLLNDLTLKGSHAQAGPFTLLGSAQYQPRGEVLKADLHGTLRGGTFTALGELPAGLNVNLNDIPTNDEDGASFGVGKLNGTLTLTGKASDPFLSGNLNVLTDQVAARLTVSGQASDPRAHVRADLQGDTTGTLYAEAQQVDFKRGTVQANVYGTVRSGQNVADVNLRGPWPDLSGTVKAQVDGLNAPVTLTGTGQGQYRVDGGPLGGGLLTLTRTDGFIPKLSGTLNLKPLSLVQDSQGQADLTVTLGGTLSAPTLAGNLTTVKAQAAGVTLLDTTGSFSGSLSGVSGTLLQAGKQVGTLSGQTLTLADFGVKTADSTVKASGSVKLNGLADLALTSVGAVQGNLKATYQQNMLSASGNVATQGFTAALNVQASQKDGWSGSARITGGPDGVLTSPASLKVTGPLAQPLLTGTAGLLGAQGRIVANPQLVQVRLVDGAGATASGAVQLQPNQAGEWVWSGATSLTRPELSLSLTPSGPLANPNLLVSLRRGEWRASGTASKSSADLSVTDGEHAGQLNWRNEQLSVNLPGLDLARLGISGLNGSVTATGTLGTRTQSGQLAFTVRNFTTPQELPVVGLQPAGNISGQVNFTGGQPRIQAQAALNVGTLNLNASQIKVPGEGGQTLSRWAGTLSGNLRQNQTKEQGREQGSLLVGLSADASGVHGKLSVSNFVVNAAGQSTTVNGEATLNGQTFTATGQIGNGRGTLRAQGGLADALPMLENVLAVNPTGDGYTARAVLSELDITRLNIAPNLKGSVSGEANLNDGGGTFFLQSAGLKLGPKTLPARIEGTQASGSWRLRGYLGETEFTGGMDAKSEVFGQANLRALPLGAMISALTGETPGEGVVTGLARFRFPLADPAAGTVNVVAERIRVSTQPEGASQVTSSTSASSTTLGLAPGATPATPAPTSTSTTTSTATTPGETLIGSGSLDYANRELRSINVQLSGAGTWDVRGQYTHRKVDLNAVFTGTTFTPVLRLIPGLLPLEPSLKGSLTLSAAGTYERPRGLLRAEKLEGSFAGLSVQVPQFAGELPDSGAFTGGGRILTGGTVGTDGTLDLSGQLTLGKLSNTRLKFSGLLAPEALGPLPNTTATLQQEGENWTVSAQSISSNPATGSGGLTLTGTVAPRWDLTLNAQNYNLPLSAIYAKESALTGSVRAVDDGNFIHVTGQADFARLTLGRVNTAATIPGPSGQSTGTAEKDSGVSNFASPLPEQYTTFPTAGTTAEAEQKRTLPLLSRLLLEDLKINAPNGIRVDENLARAEFGTSGLTVSGTGAAPRITGEIVSQRGSIFLRENEFRITEGLVKFTGAGLYPTFHIVAEGSVPSSTTNQRVPITLALDGDFRTVGGRPNVMYLHTALTCTNSADSNCVNPSTGTPYGEAELYALVATGVPNLASLPDNLTSLGSSALQTALNVFVLGELERTLARALGLDVFRLTPTLATDGTVNATFTVGSYLTRNLFLQYQVDLTGNGLIDATYTTQDRKFTIKVSTPLNGLDLQSIRPSFSAAYNFNNKASVNVGVVTKKDSTTFNFGVTYRIGAR